MKNEKNRFLRLTGIMYVSQTLSLVNPFYWRDLYNTRLGKNLFRNIYFLVHPNNAHAHTNKHSNYPLFRSISAEISDGIDKKKSVN